MKLFHTTDPLSSLPLRQRFLIKGVFALIVMVYWVERSRGPGWGDSLAFIFSALEGFSWSVNATGHFLYDNLNAGLVAFIPWADPVAMLTAVSLLFGLLTLVRIFQTSYLLTENSLAALLATIGFAFSFTFWRQVEQVEVYTCASFCTASAIHCMLADTNSGSYRNLMATGWWMGLAILVHIQTVLLFPLFFIYLFGAGAEHRRGISLSLLAVAACFMLLMIPALLLSEYTPSAVFFSFGFREEVMNFSIRSIVAGSLVSIAYAAYAFHVHLFAVILGFAGCLRRSPRVIVLTIAGIVPVWLFAMRYPVSDQYVFFLNSYLFIAILSAYGYDAITSRITGQWGRTVLVALAITASPIIYSASCRVISPLPVTRIQEFHQRKAYKGGLSYYLWPGLRTVPEFFIRFEQHLQSDIPPDNIERELWDRLYLHALNYRSLMQERER